MMLSKMSEWRKRVCHARTAGESRDDFRVIVSNSDSIGGWVIYGSVSGHEGFFVSSQRQEKRVFKSLDTLMRTLAEHEIYSFEVIGTKDK